MPVTRAPRPAIASARMPPPQPTSSTRLPASAARSSIQPRRSGLMSCSGRNSPCGSHQRCASSLNFSSSAGSAFIRTIVPKKSPAYAGLAWWLGLALLVAGAGRAAADVAGRSAAAGSRAARGRAGRRGGRAARHFTAAEELGLDSPVGLQAGDELLVARLLRAHALALVAGD